MKPRMLIVTAVVTLAATWMPAGADNVDCDGTGDEWRNYGGDRANSRNQWDEHEIDASNAGSLTELWTFNSNVQLGGGTFSNTPSIADGCVYLASSSGWVFALDAETGVLDWIAEKRMPGDTAGALVGGVITGSPVVANGKVYVGVAKMGDPFVGVLDQDNGKVLGEWPVLPPSERGTNNKYRNNIIASPVVWNGLIFMGLMADEASPVARGGWSVLDAETGAILEYGWTIDDASYEAGYRGASIWCSPAMDEETGFVYACGGNPASKKIEHRTANALLKFDLNRHLADGETPNPDFGRLVDSYKGDVDQYYPGADRQPLCDLFGDDINIVWSQACLQLDLDFGSSPNLFTIDVGGEPVKVVGALQKSGIYHAVYADHMSRAWTSIVGTPCFACNASSSAFDDGSIYVAGTAGGQVVALSKDAGRYQWAMPIPAGGTHFQPLSVANGVVYGMDNLGFLNAWDASNGLPLLKHNLMFDVGSPASALSSQGISIADGRVFAASSNFVVAYGLPS